MGRQWLVIGSWGELLVGRVARGESCLSCGVLGRAVYVGSCARMDGDQGSSTALAGNKTASCAARHGRNRLHKRRRRRHQASEDCLPLSARSAPVAQGERTGEQSGRHSAQKHVGQSIRAHMYAMSYFDCLHSLLSVSAQVFAGLPSALRGRLARVSFPTSHRACECSDLASHLRAWPR